MDGLTLYDIVMATLANGDTYCAIDYDNQVCSYSSKPTLAASNRYWIPSDGGWQHIGYYKFQCDCVNSIIDVTTITL